MITICILIQFTELVPCPYDNHATNFPYGKKRSRSISSNVLSASKYLNTIIHGKQFRSKYWFAHLFFSHNFCAGLRRERARQISKSHGCCRRRRVVRRWRVQPRYIAYKRLAGNIISCCFGTETDALEQEEMRLDEEEERKRNGKDIWVSAIFL